MQEVELKLDLDEDAAKSLETSALLPVEPERAELHATYFDTPDGALEKAGFSLRIRSSSDERVQTVKADGAAAGLFVRSEWEMPVTGSIPVLDHTTPIQAMLGTRCDALAPIFEVEVERRIWNVDHEGAQIEVSLDRGQVMAGKGRTPISEIELELKAGSPAALFGFARKLDAVAPVRIGVLSKAERGYRLAHPIPPAFKAGAVVLDRDMDAAGAFRFIAQHCLRQFRLNEALLAQRPTPEALHQARVALRRLRSAFSLFKPLYQADPQAVALREELRSLAAVLGEARNLDVLLERSQPGSLRDRLSSARNAAYEHVEQAFASPRARGLMLDLMEWFALGSWLGDDSSKSEREEPVRSFAKAVLGRARRRLKKRGRRLVKLDDETRHEVRKDAKKLRYASEFFAALFDAKRERRRYKRIIDALEALQDELGALNDLATAPEEIRKLGAEDDPHAAALLGPESKRHLIRAAADAHERFVEAKRFWR